MSDTMKKEETGQDVPLAKEEEKRPVDDPVQNDGPSEPAGSAPSPPLAVKAASIATENGNVERRANDDDKNLELEPRSKTAMDQEGQVSLRSVPVQENSQDLVKPECEPASDVKAETSRGVESNVVSVENLETEETQVKVKAEAGDLPDDKTGYVGDSLPEHNELLTPQAATSEGKAENENGVVGNMKTDVKHETTPADNGNSNSNNSFLLDDDFAYEGSVSGTEEEQSAFMKKIENFFRERNMEFKPPKFYGEGLNCLKLWRAVTKLGGYEKVTSCKLWRQVGESFKPPKTCTTVSWTFRGFYEKALLDYERHKTHGGELPVPISSHPEPMSIENQASGSGRARRDAAARAMQGWHSQRLLGNGEVSDPIIKDKNPIPVQKRDKQLKSINLLKRKKPSYMENTVKARSKPSKPQMDMAVVDIGPPADWVKINVQKTKDCFEVYALVPGLLREEVRVQSDPAGRLVISGEPEHPDNPWGITSFKKVVSLPSRIDPHQTSAVVTLHGQLFVRVPFEQSE